MPMPTEMAELATLQGEIKVALIFAGVPQEVAHRAAADALHSVATSPVASEEHRRVYAGEPSAWVSTGHRRRLQIILPPESIAADAQIMLDGEVLRDVTALSFTMNPGELAQVRLSRIGQPVQLSDTGGVELDAYLYESVPGA